MVIVRDRTFAKETIAKVLFIRYTVLICRFTVIPDSKDSCFCFANPACSPIYPKQMIVKKGEMPLREFYGTIKDV